MRGPRYLIEGDYGRGWETLLTEATRAEANARAREYGRLAPGVRHRVVRCPWRRYWLAGALAAGWLAYGVWGIYTVITRCGGRYAGH